ncbi:MAG TPA: hypothetical protein VL240_13755 [Candidatus Binatia bacterium]|nr:hypothetical protein [Candidatus Binatia bacterium]
MKSRLVMLISIVALALSATAPNALARSGKVLPPISKGSVTAASTARSAAMKKVGSKAAIPAHTILPGAKNN